MKLIDYLSETKQTYREFGALLGQSAPNICRYALGKRLPPVGVAVAIQRITGGLVTPEDFVRAADEAA